MAIVQKLPRGFESYPSIYPFLFISVQVWQDIPELFSNKLESIQKRALYIIYPFHSYLDAPNTTDLSSLKERRTQLCCKYDS